MWYWDIKITSAKVAVDHVTIQSGESEAVEFIISVLDKYYC